MSKIAQAFARGKAFIRLSPAATRIWRPPPPRSGPPWKTARTSSSWAFPSPTPPPRVR